MFAMFKRKTPPRTAALPPGERLYAIGDVHGRLDLLVALLEQIRLDSAGRGGGAATRLVFLGDLIDRGPHSAQVVRRVMSARDWAVTTTLMGNHELAMIEALDGDRDMLRMWLTQGGVAALASWGVDDRVLDAGSEPEIVAAASAAIPAAERAWIANRPLSFARGDYLFVHAGIRPGVPLDRQSRRDLLWIRDSFLLSTRDHGVVVVHGHTVCESVEDRGNRIGIDTGAYATGRLTALGLEGEARWTLST